MNYFDIYKNCTFIQQHVIFTSCGRRGSAESLVSFQPIFQIVVRKAKEPMVPCNFTHFLRKE